MDGRSDLILRMSHSIESMKLKGPERIIPSVLSVTHLQNRYLLSYLLNVSSYEE